MPLGWLVVVFRQTGDRTMPATSKCPHGERIAIWQSGLDGINWLQDLTHGGGHACFLAYNGGYPFEYTAQAKHLLPRILDEKGPPLADEMWKRDLGDILLPSYLGRTEINTDAAGEDVSACPQPRLLRERIGAPFDVPRHR